MKSLRYQDIDVKYSDLLLSKYQFNGKFFHSDLRQEKNIQLSEEEKKIYADAGREWFPTLTGFMLLNGYVFDHESESPPYYTITERGNLCRELGGHEKFKIHRKRELNLVKNQHIINVSLLVVSLLALIIPFLVDKCEVKQPINVNVPKQNTPSVTIVLDSGLLRNITKDSVNTEKRR